MDDYEKLTTTKLVTKAEIINNYSTNRGGIQNTQTLQYQPYNPHQTKSIIFHSPSTHHVTNQNAVPLIVNQVNPIYEQKVYQNPFIENGGPQKIN